jgi:hypothetical protein
MTASNLVAAWALFAATTFAQRAPIVVPRAQLPDGFQSAALITRQTGSRIDSVSAATPRVVIAPNQLLAIRAGTEPVFVSGAINDSRGPASAEFNARFVLPTRYLARSEDASAPLALRPVYVPETDLTYAPDQQVFRGSFLIGVEDTTTPSASENLSKTIAFRFVGQTEQLNPTSVDIGHTNLPLLSVSVTAASPRDSVRIHIIPQLDPAGADVWLHVTPTLKFFQLPRSVQGFGVENATVVVGAAGTSLRDTLVVTLTTTAGVVDPAQVELGATGAATAHLRSRGLGPVTVSAVALGFTPITAIVPFVFPWAFVIAALFGGAVGGAIKAKAPAGLLASSARGAAIGSVVALALLGGLFGIRG